jgi:hypothetical protein
MATDMRGYGAALISLAEAIDDAKGKITMSNLESMSAMDLLRMCGTNNIRFIYTGQTKSKVAKGEKP